MAKIKKSPETKNTFKECTPSISKMMRHWRGQSSENDKGGSFNLQLYLDYCTHVYSPK